MIAKKKRIKYKQQTSSINFVTGKIIRFLTEIILLWTTVVFSSSSSYVVDVIKPFFGGNLDLSKIKKLKKVLI